MFADVREDVVTFWNDCASAAGGVLGNDTFISSAFGEDTAATAAAAFIVDANSLLARFLLASVSQGDGAPGCRYETCLRSASLLRETCEQTLQAYLRRTRNSYCYKLSS